MNRTDTWARARHAACVMVSGVLAGCQPAGEGRGRLLLEQYDCGSCHIIPGVRRAHGRLGPTLETFALRTYIAGELPNQPEVLTLWIQRPSALVPDTLMPDQHLPDSHARDISAYLMSLR
jgi:cytochrome c